MLILLYLWWIPNSTVCNMQGKDYANEVIYDRCKMRFFDVFNENILLKKKKKKELV